MKSIIYLAALFTAVTATMPTSAQERWSAPVGVITHDGSLELALAPRSPIEVEITIRHESFTAGQYARYAQKYLGVRASLADRNKFSIAGATIALASDDHNRSQANVGVGESVVELGTLAVDISSANLPAMEQSAADAAAAIFKMRQNCKDLISGDVGEGVFGAGLATAIEQYEKMEREYLELFMGRSVTTVTTSRMVIYTSNESSEYLVARFSSERGLLDVSDLTGEPIFLQITPSANEKLEGVVDESLPLEKDRKVASFAVANLSRCTLSAGSESLSSVQLPLFEYGQMVKYSVKR